MNLSMAQFFSHKLAVKHRQPSSNLSQVMSVVPPFQSEEELDFTLMNFFEEKIEIFFAFDETVIFF